MKEVARIIKNKENGVYELCIAYKILKPNPSNEEIQKDYLPTNYRHRTNLFYIVSLAI